MKQNKQTKPSPVASAAPIGRDGGGAGQFYGKISTRIEPGGRGGGGVTEGDLNKIRFLLEKTK